MTLASANFELSRGEFLLSTDPNRLDRDAIHTFLSQSYWGRERPRPVLERAIDNSLCFGLYRGAEQIGFARAITDFSTFGYLADVYILEPYRRQGLGLWVIQTILNHPEVKLLRRWFLLTRDMHPLYAQCGFTACQRPEDVMERTQPYPQNV